MTWATPRSEPAVRALSLAAVALVAVVAFVALPRLTASPPPTDPAGATSCQDLAERFVTLDQVLLDRIGGRTLAEYEQLAEDEPPDWLLELNEEFSRFPSHGSELGCPDDEVEATICAGTDTLDPHGEAGRDVVDRLRVNLCSDATTS